LQADQTGATENGSGTRRPSVAQRRRLRAALLEIDGLGEPGIRGAVLRELRGELHGFDPDRFTKSNLDVFGIFSECVRLDQAELFVDVLALVLDESDEWRAFSHLVREFCTPPALTATERELLRDALAAVPAEIVTRAVITCGLDALVGSGGLGAIGGPEVLTLIESASGPPDGSPGVLRFVEVVAHAADPEQDRELHRLAAVVAARLGVTDGLLEICRSVSSVPTQDTTPPTGQSGESDDSVPPSSQTDTGAEDMQITTSAPPMPVMVPALMRGLPPRNSYFSGRAELLVEIRETLSNLSEAAVLPHALHGLGGVGKTQVALEFAYRFSNVYDLVFWIPAADEEAIRRSLVSLGKSLDIPETADVQYMIDNTLDAMRLGLKYPNWLLIFDNAADVKTVRRYIPSGGRGHVIITSRNLEWRGVSRFIEVNVFSSEESVAFLQRRWPDLGSEQAILLAGRLGNLPLALNQAAAFHAETGMGLDEYLTNYDDLVETVTSTTPTDYPEPVAATWRMAFDKLRSDAPAAAQLLQLCCFLSSEPISIPMLRAGRGAALAPELKTALQSELSFRRAVQALGKYALAQIDTARDFLTVHSLVRAVLRDALDADDKAAAQHAAHEVLAFANPGDPDDGETWSRHRQITPHVVPSGLVYADDPHVRQVAIDQVRFYFATGDYDMSRRIAEHILDNWRSRFGPDDVLTLRVRFHLGNALRMLGDYPRSRQETFETHSQLERTLGSGHEYTLAVANSLGADLRLLGEFDKALERDRQTLDQHRATSDIDEVSALRAANNVAVDYRLLGKFQEAWEIDQVNVRERTRSDVASYDQETLSSTNNLSRDLIGLGRYKEALTTQLERLPVFESHLGPDHRAVLTARRNLAIVYRKLGDLPDAHGLAKSSEEAFRRLFGPRQDTTLSAAMTLVNTMRARGDVMAARTLAEETREAYVSTFVPNHPFVLMCEVNLAVVYRALGMRDEAYELGRAALAALRSRLGDDHPHVLISAANHTNDLSSAGATAAALELSRDTYDRSLRVRVAQHPNTLSAAANLALDLDANGQHDEAAALRRTTIEQMRMVFGPEHPETINVERGRRPELDIEVAPL
jgi:tetratricopeptide (TPR) repeat protein